MTAIILTVNSRFRRRQIIQITLVVQYIEVMAYDDVQLQVEYDCNWQCD